MFNSLVNILLSLITGFIAGFFVNNIFKEIEDTRVLKRCVDKFQAYLGDISDTLECLTQEDANDFTLNRLKYLLLDERVRDISQMLNETKVTEKTGTAMSIVVKLEGEFRWKNIFERKKKADVLSLQKQIIKERKLLIDFERSMPVPKFYECINFIKLILVILAVISIWLIALAINS